MSKTENLTKLATLKKFFLNWLRDAIMKNIVGQSKWIQKKLATLITQLSIRYTQSPIIDYDTNQRTGKLRPGERMLDITLIDGSTRLLDFLHHTQHHLFLFTGPLVNEAILLKVRNIQEL